MKKVLRKIKRSVFHNLQLYPIYKVLEKINDHYSLKDCRALEAFAYQGNLQAIAYRHLPKYHEAWEIAEDCKPHLEKNLPNATIRITNSFEEVLRCKQKFNFINVDTHQGIFGNYCENFEFFPLLFNVAEDECIVNLNVIPNASSKWKRKYTDLFNEEHLARRKAFYKTNQPEEVSLTEMLKVYGDIAANFGYEIVWHEYLQRTLTYYLVLHLKKAKS